MGQVRPMQAAWVEVLQDIEFAWFLTLTVGKMRRLHPEAARKKIRLLLRRYLEVRFGNLDARTMTAIAALWSFEAHKDGRLHIHALLTAPYLDKDDQPGRLLLMSLWDAGEYAHERSMLEGHARCLPAQADAAKAYCVKSYATKGGEVEWNDELHELMRGQRVKRFCVREADEAGPQVLVLQCEPAGRRG